MEELNKNHKELAVEISSIISEYLQEKKYLSLKQISHNTNIAYSYLRRLHLAEIPESKIDPVRVFLLLKKIKGIEFAAPFISQYEAWEKKVKSWTGYDLDSYKNRVESVEHESFVMENNHRVVAFILASNNSGVTKDGLVDIGGQPLLAAAMDLVDNETITIDETDTFRSSMLDDGAKFLFSLKNCKKINQILIDYYDHSRAGNNRNFTFFTTESVNREFLSLALDKLLELRKWFNDNVSKEANKGDIPFFISSTMDTLTEQLGKTKRTLQ